jgi:hypothetical protein
MVALMRLWIFFVVLCCLFFGALAYDFRVELQTAQSIQTRMLALVERQQAQLNDLQEVMKRLALE